MVLITTTGFKPQAKYLHKGVGLAPKSKGCCHHPSETGSCRNHPAFQGSLQCPLNGRQERQQPAGSLLEALRKSETQGQRGPSHPQLPTPCHLLGTQVVGDKGSRLWKPSLCAPSRCPSLSPSPRVVASAPCCGPWRGIPHSHLPTEAKQALGSSSQFWLFLVVTALGHSRVNWASSAPPEAS
jgi:hypothetical protein